MSEKQNKLNNQVINREAEVEPKSHCCCFTFSCCDKKTYLIGDNNINKDNTDNKIDSKINPKVSII